MKVTLVEFLCGLVVVLVVAAYPTFWIVGSYFEAQSFNKINPDKQVTTWDAMWLELRGQ